MTRPDAIFLGDPALLDAVYGPDRRAAASAAARVIGEATPDAVRSDPSRLGGAEVVLSTWGMPRLDAPLLDAAPALRAVLYAAGSIRPFATDASWDRGVAVSSAYAANAVPVAEMTLSQVIFCLKLGWQNALALKRDRRWRAAGPIPGAYGSRVGVVALGAIGRMVCEYLKRLDVEVLAYDVAPDPAVADALGVRLAPLDEVFAACDVVSLHLPWLPETVGMITADLVASMRPNASLINTARGAVVDEPGLCRVLAARPDLVAVLDVTHPEPPPPDSPLWDLPNAVLLPHVAGSMGGERRRLGRYMLDELARLAAGEPLRWALTREQAGRMA